MDSYISNPALHYNSISGYALITSMEVLPEIYKRIYFQVFYNFLL